MPKARLLSELGLNARKGENPLLCGLTADSRAVRPGFLFAALPGTNRHGAEFVAEVIRAGAAAILTDPAGARHLPADADRVALIVVDDPREALARAAALWFGAQPEIMAAVTGTNGKTSVACFTRQIWQMLGHAAINIGTTGIEGDWAEPSARTTPDPITLQRVLADAAAAGITHAAMEASSHGLDQRRLDGVRLRSAGFTNLTQDHLDYHHDMESYFEAKAGLFTRLLPADGWAVINLDGAMGRQMAERMEGRGLQMLLVGQSADADLRIAATRPHATGQELRLIWKQNPVQVHLDLIGGFQASNVAVAAGLAITCGEKAGDVFAVLSRLQGVRGRMQHVATRRNGATVFVDYAHTPDAIATALRALRPHVMGRLLIVFGAGGDRDRSKRPLMGRAASENADGVYVTDDNPRSEEPAAIRAAILAGCPDAEEIGDRAEAILRATDALQSGDALLIAGKGHETGQEIMGNVFPFDDSEQASIAVAALDGMI